MKGKIIVLHILLLIIISGVVGCNNNNSIEDTTWILTSYGEPSNLKSVIGDKQVTVYFNSDEKKVQGSAGCNNYFSTYTIKGNEISISEPIGTTMMTCGEEIDNQEGEYLSILIGAENFEVEGNKLFLSTSNELLIFVQQ